MVSTPVAVIRNTRTALRAGLQGSSTQDLEEGSTLGGTHHTVREGLHNPIPSRSLRLQQNQEAESEKPNDQS